MDNRIKITGKIKGTVSDFKAKDFKFAFGRVTQFRGDVQMTGLPDIKETFSHLNITDFETNYKDVTDLRLPMPGETIGLPDFLVTLGGIKIKGFFTGFYNNFVSYASFDTDIGKVKTDLLVKVNDTKNIEYVGKLIALKFNAGKMFNAGNYLGRLDLNADITGSGIEFENMNLNMDGVVSSLELFNYTYNQIAISGNLSEQKFTGKLDVSDKNINLDFDGIIDYSENVPIYNFTSVIKNAKLQNINLMEHDTSMTFSTTMNINLMGDKLDNMQGILILDKTVYSEKGSQYRMKDFTLSITRDSSKYAMIRLFSDIADASIEGTYSLYNLPVNIKNVFDQYLNSLFPDMPYTVEDLPIQDFIFDIELKNTHPVTSVLLPALNLYTEQRLRVDTTPGSTAFSLKEGSNQIVYNDIKIRDWNSEFYLGHDEMVLITECSQIFLNDTLSLDSINLVSSAKNDTIHYTLNLKHKEAPYNNYGSFSGQLALFEKDKMEIKFDTADVFYNNILWSVSPHNLISIDSSSAHFQDVSLRSTTAQFMVHGNISTMPSDSLVIDFSNFNISNADMFLKNMNIDLNGVINGSLNISNAYGSPTFLSDIMINDLYFNQEKLGDAKLKTTWNTQDEAFEILASIIYTGNIGQSNMLSIEGTYYPHREEENFFIDIDLYNYKLNTLEPFIRSFSSNLEGMASGEIRLRGSKEKPDLTGVINLMRTRLKIDYLNVTYNLADKLELEKNLIRFDNITVYDSLNNEATGSGKLYHNHLKDFNLDLEFDARQLAGLNTKRSQNSTFYGSAFASGKVKIYGPFDNLNLEINVRSEKGTNITIPASAASEVMENDYIIFINSEYDSEQKKKSYDVDMNGVALSLGLNVTHDANIQLFLPYQMGNIRGNGKGDIIMKVNRSGQFTMDGGYEIYRGSLFLTLQGIINRDFDIKRGSKVSWTGDPYDADIDLKAVYKVKTALGEYGPPEDSASRVNVDCVIALSNKLFNPEIRFTVEFPDLKEDQKQYIFTRIDTNDQAMMSQQMISLLVMNSFYHSTGSSGSFSFNTFSLLTNQLNNWLSNISNDFDIGVNYRPGDDISAQELEVALSTQLWDERVLVDGNVGMRGSEEAREANSIVGEVNVEVKITEDGRFRAKAFNKSNNNYLYKNYAPYTRCWRILYERVLPFQGFVQITKKNTKKQKRNPKKPEEISDN
ncbi:MAG: translocation/assembly module TamB domain-containing protein [Bacteroidales bacterium]